MRCEDIKEELVSFVLGELNGNEQEAISAHLDSCELCRSEVEQYRQVLLALGRWKVPPHGRPPSFAFMPAPSLPDEKKPARKRRFGRVGVDIVGAAFAVILIVGLLFTIHIDYRNGVLSINIGTVASRYVPADSARIAAIVDSVRQEDMRLVSQMISASETRQAKLYHAELASFSRQLNSQQRSYLTYMMDHIYRLQQQDQIAYYQSSAALDGVVKLASSVR